MQPLSHLRPLGLGEILDGAFTLYRRHFGQFFLAALFPQIPLIVLWLVAGPLLGAAVGDETDPMAVMAGAAVFVPLLIVFSIAAYLFPLGTLTRMAADTYLGNPLDRPEATRSTWRNLLSLAAMAILVTLLVGIGLVFCFIPGILASIIFFACIPVVVLEGQSPVDALNRSQQLAKGAWGEIFVTQLLFWMMTALPAGAVGFMVTLAAAALAPEGDVAVSLQMASNAVQALMTALTMPLTLIGTTLLYYDRRIRTEAFGLDADLAALEMA